MKKEFEFEFDFYLFSVVAFDGNGGNVFPSELTDHFDNGLRLEIVRWNDATEIFESRLVGQFGTRRRVANLRNLQKK